MSRKAKVFLAFIAVIFLLAITGALIIVESPATMRLKKSDERRISDLRIIILAASDLYETDRKVPQSVQEIDDRLTRLIPRSDPETGEAYAYRVVGESQIEVCGHFATSNMNTRGVAAVNIGSRRHDLGHDVGTYCFTIDLVRPSSDERINLKAPT